jgi:predicted nucleic acid-binding protein
MKKVFLDTNVCLDVILNREPFAVDAGQIFEMGKQREIKLFVSAVSFTTIFYILKRLYHTKQALIDLKEFRKFVTITNVNTTVIDLALHSELHDFEDAVLYFSAKESDINLIITRNAKDFEGASLKVLTPKQFLKTE